ncbi:MAG: exonuclease SbcCD subunit D [Christensenellaceae bacterium]|nr:exonuclease SbcCD subunit D [Christensenellaceae bacterium]
MADLHLGKALNGFPLLEDQRFLLDQILELAKEKRPDALLLAGDVYDRNSPSAEAIRALDDFLTALSREGIKVFLVSGNHDSPERLGFGGRLLEESGVFVHARFEGCVKTLRLDDRHGPVFFHLLPYLHPALARLFYPEDAIESHEDAVRAALSRLQLDEGMRNVFIGHQFFAGRSEEPRRADSETAYVGGLDRVSADLLRAFDYAALGHLHAPQALLGGERIRYAGSPLKYSASEAGQSKGLPMVDLGAKGDVSLKLLPLRPRRDLRRLRGPLAELLANAIAQGPIEDYIHITLTDEGALYDALSRLRQVYPNLLELRFETREAAESSAESDLPAEELAPEELFARFYLEQRGEELSDAQKALVSRFLQKGVLP